MNESDKLSSEEIVQRRDAFIERFLGYARARSIFLQYISASDLVSIARLQTAH